MDACHPPNSVEYRSSETLARPSPARARTHYVAIGAQCTHAGCILSAVALIEHRARRPKPPKASASPGETDGQAKALPRLPVFVRSSSDRRRYPHCCSCRPAVSSFAGRQQALRDAHCRSAEEAAVWCRREPRRVLLPSCRRQLEPVAQFRFHRIACKPCASTRCVRLARSTFLENQGETPELSATQVCQRVAVASGAQIKAGPPATRLAQRRRRGPSRCLPQRQDVAAIRTTAPSRPERKL
jgi:hypothetical protein